MKVLDKASLASTFNSVNHAMLFGEEVGARERLATARWIAGRRGLPGAYAGMFAPTESDESYRLFTGERVAHAAARHIAGEEACRALRLLDVDDRDVVEALEGASASMAERLRRNESPGVF